MWRIYRKNGFRKLGGPIPLTRSPSFVISVPGFALKSYRMIVKKQRRISEKRVSGGGGDCGNDDTRHKIQLGGLVIKAGLAGEEPAVLLGIITAAKWVLSVK
jgi:conjugative transfer protein TraD